MLDYLDLTRFRGRDLASGHYCFDDGGSGTGTGGTPAGDAGATGDGTGNSSAGAGATNLSQEDVDRIVQERLGRDRSSLFKKLGVKDESELQGVLKAHQEQIDKDKSDHEKALDEARTTARSEGEKSVLEKANARAIRAEFILQAKDAGIVAPADAYNIAKAQNLLADIAVDDDTDEVKGLDDKFFKDFLKDRAYLVNKGEGGEGAGGEGEGTGTGQTPPANANAGAAGAALPKDKAERRKVLEERYPALARR